MPYLQPTPINPKGAAIFFTGLSGAGKSTIAIALQQRLLGLVNSSVTLLDGDDVRKQLTPKLGFSKTDRNGHIKHVTSLACDIAASGGVALCAVIAPYDDARRAARRELSRLGRFLLVYVATPLEECERRDPKGLYARARSGAIANFTGISDPYEVPADADLVIETTTVALHDAVGLIVDRLESTRLQDEITKYRTMEPIFGLDRTT